MWSTIEQPKWEGVTHMRLWENWYLFVSVWLVYFISSKNGSFLFLMSTSVNIPTPSFTWHKRTGSQLKAWRTTPSQGLMNTQDYTLYHHTKSRWTEITHYLTSEAGDLQATNVSLFSRRPRLRESSLGLLKQFGRTLRRRGSFVIRIVNYWNWLPHQPSNNT